MSEQHIFYHPERTVFGQGSAINAGEYFQKLDCKKVFVVTDKVIVNLDAFNNVIKSLVKNEIGYQIYAEVDENPTDMQVQKGADKYNKTNCDCLLSIGGGSSIDSAKAIGILVNNGGAIKDYNGFDLFPNPIPPLITIPTTAGTGSEVTIFCVVTNTENNFKMAPGGYKMLPRVALIDSEMMESMPPIVTAATGIDALSHAVEAYCSKISMPQTDALALAAIRLISENIGPAVANGSNMKARDGMAMGSLQAGMAFSSAGCGGIHALGHQLTTQYGLAHGTAMGIMMPIMLLYNSIACADKIVDIAVAMGEKVDRLPKMAAAARAAVAIYELQKSVGLPTNLDECNADKNLIAECVKWAARDGDLETNPRILPENAIESIYKSALDFALN